MPSRLPITDAARARRHVLGQTMYRLRKHYKFFKRLGLNHNARKVRARMRELAREYEAVGGKPESMESEGPV